MVTNICKAVGDRRPCPLLKITLSDAADEVNRLGGPSNNGNRAMMMPLSLKWYSNPIGYRSEAIETRFWKGISV